MTARRAVLTVAAVPALWVGAWAAIAWNRERIEAWVYRPRGAR